MDNPTAVDRRKFLGALGVTVVVLFMLLEREDLRNRLIGLIGHGHLATTTKAFDEAGRRVSRQLLLQTLVNLIYGRKKKLKGVSIGQVWRPDIAPGAKA